MTEASAKSQPRSKFPKRSKVKKNAVQASGAVTKHDRVLGLLRSKNGTTIAAISKATGWQPHSVRGFLAGIVKKKLGLTIASEETNSGRVYRISGAKSSDPSRSAAAMQEPNNA